MDIFLKPLDLLLHIVNVLILFFFLRWLLYKPVTKFLRERDERIEAARDEIRRGQDEVNSQIQHYNQLIESARDESARIVQQSNELAREHAKEIVASAKAEADEIIARAEREAQYTRAHAKDVLRNEIADMAVDIASKIVKREISAEDNRAIIEDFFKKVV
ncbi:MAG: F0F1 ATP synthase subunit B [Bacillota bacterium]